MIHYHYTVTLGICVAAVPHSNAVGEYALSGAVASSLGVVKDIRLVLAS